LRFLNTPKINNFGYLNREFQPETGYTDLVNRQFDNIIGRFTSQDPIIEGQEHLSLYQYGLNNPLRYTDPDGRMAVECCGETGAAIGGFMSGLGESIVRNAKALTVNLPETIQGFGSLANPVGQMQAAIGGAMLYDKTKSDWNTGDTRTRANIVGNIVGEIGIAVAGSKGVGSLGKAGVVSDIAKVGEVAEISKISPNVQNVLNTISDFNKAGGIQKNTLKAIDKQEINWTFKNTDGSRMEFRIESHDLPTKLGGKGDGNPVRHLNAEVFNSSGNQVKMKHINGGHKILE
jgi:RHS repeat-associated protein